MSLSLNPILVLLILQKMKNPLIIFISLMLFACTGEKSQTKEASTSTAESVEVTLTDAQIKNAGIETGKAEMRSLNRTLVLSGEVDVPPQNLHSVTFPMGGFLRSTKLLPGMKVSKGEVIAVMEDRAYIDLQQDYLITKNKLQFLEKEYKRQQQLNEAKTTSDKVFEQTTADYRSQLIQLNALAQKLVLIGINPARLSENNISRHVNVHSPITGFVSAVHANIGKYVNPSEVLFDLVNPDDLHLALTVFEKDLNEIQAGQMVTAYLPSDTSKTFSAKIVVVNKNLDSNRSAVVHCHFLSSQTSLHPGMYLNAGIKIKSKPALTVPEEAVVRFADKEYIFTDKGNNTFRLTEVKTGTGESGFQQVNLDPAELQNERIVTKNAYSVLMKMKNTTEE